MFAIRNYRISKESCGDRYTLTHEAAPDLAMLYMVSEDNECPWLLQLLKGLWDGIDG